MAKQLAPIWDCPHGKQWALGCRECFREELRDRMQRSLLSDVDYKQPIVSHGRRVPKAPGCP